MAGTIKVNRIDIETMKQDPMRYALVYKINKLKEELETIPESHIFERDTIQQKINKLEGIYNKRLEKIRAKRNQ